MPNGTVKFFNAAKKFGFVSPDDGGKDVFVPIASVTAAGVAALVAGQRVAFETAPDGKGPKAINLKLIETPPPAPAVRPPAPSAPNAPSPRAEDRAPPLTFYYDTGSESGARMLAMLRASGFEPRVVDYIARPPSADELKRVSMLLHGGSLVKRYDPLFHELRLDDRFIGQNEFWQGIFEHPVLINGPVLATANSACICRSDDTVKNFIAAAFPGRTLQAVEEKPAPKRAAPAEIETPADVESAPEPVKAKASARMSEPPEAEPVAADADKPLKKTAKAAPKKTKSAEVKPPAKKTVKKAAATKPAAKATRAKTKK